MMDVAELKKLAVDRYVNIKRIQKSLKAKDVVDEEVELQVQIAEIDLQSFGIDYSKLTI